MEANLPVSPPADAAAQTAKGPSSSGTFPFSNWGPWAAVGGLLIALVSQILPAIPIAIIDPAATEDPGAALSSLLQLFTVAAFLATPFLIAGMHGAKGREALKRLGVRRFDSSAFAWMGVAVGVYLAFAMLYAALVGVPEQDDIASDFGPVPVQILLIVFGAGISEELCFRGMLFGGLSERLHVLFAAFVSAAVFGILHAFSGISAVPPLIVFGFAMAMLYAKTGSIIPGILLHMLNNSVALLGQ
jgi:membrane protease YdiL (CAAX protease family)